MLQASTAAPRSPSIGPLYRKLRPRPNGPSREDVVANQRARLHGAMLEATAAHGYPDTSVAELCRLAGVSKRTFYEQFDNKEACFLASYERVASCATARLSASVADCSWQNQIATVLDRLLSLVAEQPNAARLTLLEARSAGPSAASRWEATRLTLEQLVFAAWPREHAGIEMPAVLASGIVGGIERVICKALLQGRLDDPAKLAASLSRWVAAYDSPSLVLLDGANTSEGMPSLPHPSRRSRLASRRARVLRAAAEIVATEGYDRLTLARIAIHGGLEESVVLSYYADPATCFLDAIDVLGLEAIIGALEACRDAGDGPAGVCMGIGALMERIATDPLVRGAIAVESTLVGPAAQRGESVLYNIATVLLARIPDADVGSWVAAEATLGALWSVICHHVSRDSTHLLPGLTGHVAFLALAPVVSPESLSVALDTYADKATGRSLAIS